MCLCVFAEESFKGRRTSLSQWLEFANRRWEAPTAAAHGQWALSLSSPRACVCTAVPPPPHDDDHKEGTKVREARTRQALKAEGTARVPLADLMPPKSVAQ